MKTRTSRGLIFKTGLIASLRCLSRRLSCCLCIKVMVELLWVHVHRHIAIFTKAYVVHIWAPFVAGYSWSGTRASTTFLCSIPRVRYMQSKMQNRRWLRAKGNCSSVQLYMPLLRTSCFTLEIKRARCYEANVKRLAWATIGQPPALTIFCMSARAVLQCMRLRHLYTEDCEGWWCPVIAAECYVEHWKLKPGDLGPVPSNCQPFLPSISPHNI